MFERALREAIAVWGLECSAEQLAAMRGHFEAVVEANRRFNLTRIVDPVEAAVKHYADSLAMCVWARDRGVEVGSVLDVGTGAGFPAIPLAIVRPGWRVTALEATEKKARFVEEAVGTLELENVTVWHGHLAHWDCAERFDVVTFRAVGSLGKMLPMAAKFVRKGGWIVAYKTRDLEAEERREADRRVKSLSLVGTEPFAYDLVGAGETARRALYVYQKG